MPDNSSKVAEADRFIHGHGFSDTLERLARTDPDRVYLRDRHRTQTVAELNRRVDAFAEALRRRGIRAESRVVLSLDVGIDHVALIFALLRIGSLWVPMNTQVRGEPLKHQLRDSRADVIIAEANGPLVVNLQKTALADDIEVPDPGELNLVVISSASILDGSQRSNSGHATAKPLDDACLLMYTSGTTGPPKGALVSEAMLKAAVLGAIEVTEPRVGDVFYVWEPLFHIGGAQVVFLPLFCEITLALVPKFSASQFWRDIVNFDVTHIHYLGGILQILLQLSPVDEETRNRVRIAWGAGATPEVRDQCHSRYGFAVHECYGMTEASSIVTVNRNESTSGVGAPFPWIDIDIDAPKGETASLAKGEIRIRSRIEGLLTKGYLGNLEATVKARDGEWFKTGDLGYLDERGNLHFVGRDSDSIRVRGENVSAWQIESIFGLHPDVDRCAVIGVDAEVGEQEMMLVITEAESHRVKPQEVLEWGRSQLAKFQVPRYLKVVSEMPITPSQRIAKHRLPRDLNSAFDAG